MIQATLKNSSLRGTKTKLLRSSVVVHVPLGDHQWEMEQSEQKFRASGVQGLKLFPRKASCGSQ